MAIFFLLGVYCCPCLTMATSCCPLVHLSPVRHLWERVRSLCPQLCLLRACGDTLQSNLFRPGTLGGVGKSHLAIFQVCHVGQSDAGEPAAWVEQWLCSIPGTNMLSSPELNFPMGLSAHPKRKKCLTDHFAGGGVVLELAIGIWRLCGCFHFHFSHFLGFFVNHRFKVSF